MHYYAGEKLVQRSQTADVKIIELSQANIQRSKRGEVVEQKKIYPAPFLVVALKHSSGARRGAGATTITAPQEGARAVE